MTKKFVFVNTDGNYEESLGAFEAAEHVNASAGVGDAGKPIVLDAAGLIDTSMLPESDVVSYTVGAGGVTLGDLVYISANDTVLPLSTLTDPERGIGLAKTTEAAAASVAVMANDTVLAGALTGATAGDVYYWTGSGLSTTKPSLNNEHVWQVGVAKNATDLHVEIRFIKKNRV